VRNTGTPTWNVLKISGVSHMRVQPFRGENTFCFSLELLEPPRDCFSAGKLWRRKSDSSQI